MGMSRSLLKFVDQALLDEDVILAFTSWFGGAPSAVVSKSFHGDRQLAMGLAATKAFGGLQHGIPRIGRCAKLGHHMINTR